MQFQGKKWNYLISRVFFAWTLLNFLAHCANCIFFSDFSPLWCTTARIFVWNVTQAAICQMKYVLLQFPWLSSRIPLHNLSKLLTLFIILRDWKNSHVVYADDENYTAKFTIKRGHALPFDPQHAKVLCNVVLFLISMA